MWKWQHIFSVLKVSTDDLVNNNFFYILDFTMVVYCSSNFGAILFFNAETPFAIY